MGSSEHTLPDQPAVNQLLTLAEQAFLQGNYAVTEELVVATERHTGVTPTSLLVLALSQLKQVKLTDFWATISRAKAISRHDQELVSICENVAQVVRTYTVDSRELSMEIHDAVEFLARHPERGRSAQVCEIQEDDNSRPLRVHSLYDVVVVGSEGSIVDPSTATVIKNSFSSMHADNVDVTKIEPRLKIELNTACYVPGITAHLCGRWSGNFFHWVSELLPRAYFLRKMGFDGWYMVPCCMHPFILESLEMLGIPRERIICNNPRVTIRCEALVTFDSLRFLNHYDNPWILGELREALLGQVDTISPLPQGAKGIYIVRQGIRAVRNDKEVQELLAKSGMLAIQAEKLTFREQMSLAARSRFLFGPHGAGLTLALFMPPKSTMVEFVPAGYLNTCYDYIAHLMLHRHFMIPAVDNLESHDKERIEPSIRLLKQILRRELA